jgi:HEAT repeat protein
MGAWTMALALGLTQAQAGPESADLAALILRLGHADPAARDQATVELSQWGPSARPPVRALALDGAAEPEARHRASRILRIYDLVEAAPPGFRAERRPMLAPLATEDWPQVWRDLTTLVFDDGLQAGGTVSEALTHERRAAVAWYLGRLLASDAPDAHKARAAVALGRLGLLEAIRPYADRLLGWLAAAGDAEILVLQDLMTKLDQDMDDPAILVQLRDHPRLLAQVQIVPWLRRRPEAREALLDLLAYPALDTCEAAAHLLAEGQVYEAAPRIAEVLEALLPESSSQLIASAAALNAVEATPALLKLLRDGRGRYADDVATALIALGPADCVEPLQAMLRDAGPDAAIEIIRVLRVAEAREAAPLIAPLAMQGSSPLRLTALQALDAMDPRVHRDVVQASLSALVEEGYAPAIRYQTQREEVAAVAERIPPPGPPPPPEPSRGDRSDAAPTDEVRQAIALLAHERDAVRQTAAALLAQRQAFEAAPALTPLLRDPNVAVRLEALRALRTLGPEPIAEHAEALLNDASPEVRLETVRALGCFPREIPLLCRALEDPAHAVRLAAVRALAGLDRDRGIAALAAMLEAPDARLWPEAADLLAKLGERRFLPRIFELIDLNRARWTPAINHARPVLVRVAASMMDPGDGLRLAGYLDDPDPNVCRAAVESVALLGGEGVAARVAPLLAHRSDALREAAAAGLRRLPDAEVVEVVAPHLASPFAFEREAAVWALRDRADAEARRLLESMNADPSPRVRRALKEDFRPSARALPRENRPIIHFSSEVDFDIGVELTSLTLTNTSAGTIPEGQPPPPPRCDHAAR